MACGVWGCIYSVWWSAHVCHGAYLLTIRGILNLTLVFLELLAANFKQPNSGKRICFIQNSKTFLSSGIMRRGFIGTGAHHLRGGLQRPNEISGGCATRLFARNGEIRFRILHYLQNASKKINAQSFTVRSAVYKRCVRSTPYKSGDPNVFSRVRDFSTLEKQASDFASEWLKNWCVKI